MTEQSVPKPSPAWQPIETAPHNTSVLLGWRDWRDGQWCMEVGPATTGQQYDNGYSNRSQHGSATHWRPRPEPPDDVAIPDGDTGGEA